MHFENILCLTDLTTASDEAMREARKLAFRHHAALTILHVIASPDYFSVLFPDRHENRTADKPRRMHEAVGRVSERTTEITGASSGQFSVVVETGRQDDATLMIAGELHCDLIVIPEGDFLANIVRSAHCSVLIVRKQDGSNILAATDLSDPSLPALSAAGELAHESQKELTALSSFDFPTIPAFEFGAFVFSENEINTIIHSLNDHLQTAMDQAHATGNAVVECGPEVDAILRTASRLHSGLVVVGSREQGLLPRLLLGNVAVPVAKQAACSVLVVRSKPEVAVET